MATPHPESQDPTGDVGQFNGLNPEDLAAIRAGKRRVEEARLPGETGGWSVYRVVFDDDCDYVGYTSKVIAWKVDELCDPAHKNAGRWLVLHDREMGKTIECLASGLDRGDAMVLKNHFIEQAEDEYERRRKEGTAPDPCHIDIYLADHSAMARYEQAQDEYARRREEGTIRVVERHVAKRSSRDATMPNRDDETVGPEHFSGWPGTLSTERLEEIIRYSRVSNLAVMRFYNRSSYNQAQRDMEMMAASMRNCSLVGTLPQDRLEHIGREGDLAAFEDLLREQESDTDFCGGLVIDDTPDTDENPWLIAFRYLFALSRDPDWIGLSPQLPHMKGLHVHAFESSTRPGRTGFFLGLPEKLLPAERPALGPVPEGEAGLLAEIAAWHGARSFHWIPVSLQG